MLDFASFVVSSRISTFARRNSDRKISWMLETMSVKTADIDLPFCNLLGVAMIPLIAGQVLWKQLNRPSSRVRPEIQARLRRQASARDNGAPSPQRRSSSRAHH